MSDKQRKIFKIIVIVLSVILVTELIYFGVKYYINRQNSVFYTVFNSIVIDDNDYIGVGFSDYRNSDFNKYSNGYNKATIFKYNSGEIVQEVGINVGYNSFFYDVIDVSDGYIAVGSVEMTDDQNNEKLSEGLIVKFDKEFNILWRKNISILNKTELLKIEELDNGEFLVAGSSTYGEGYVGNHTTGGAILLKFDKDGEELFRVNYGGPYSGKFNDILVEDDGYVAVGLGKSNSGIIVKYNLNGKMVWDSSYGATDENGITAVDKLGNNYVVATTKVVDSKDLSNYQAAIVIFNDSGEKIDDVKYSSSDITCFSDLLVDNDDNIIASGYTGKLNSDSVLNSDAIVVKFDKNLYEQDVKLLNGDNNDMFNKIYLNNNNYIVLGYSNSKIKGYNLNGYDYFPIIENYSFS